MINFLLCSALNQRGISLDTRWIGLGISSILVAIWLMAYGLPQGEKTTTFVIGAAAIQHVIGYRLGKYMHHLKQMAFHDSLTGVLVNRRFFEKLQRKIDRARKDRSLVTLLFIDLDNFKMFNDSYGHIEGDKLLYEFAQVLQSCVGNQDLVGRWGGEEFVVMLDHSDTENGLIVGEHIQNLVRRHLSGLTVSIGVATYPSHAADAGELTLIADKLMYEAKKQKDCILAASNE
jgi:diguanylate cyclase